MLAPGDVVDGRYKVLSQLGEGGMGAVFIVEHTHMRKRMALKVLHPHVQNPEILARFEREAMASSNIDHPNVAAASDFGRTADGGFFMVLEYIDGASLRRTLEDGPMPEGRAVAIARQIASALSKAHELGVVHRDLKPDNVMLVARDGGDLVKVLDFGIAKVAVDHFGTAQGTDTGPALTQLGAVFGTPEYMAPEQAQGLEVDARADLYALGVMLFEMVTGRLPIDGADFVELLTKRVTEDAPSVRSYAPHVSPALEALTTALLQRSPDARPSTAREVLAALETMTAGETPSPVSVSRPDVAARISSVGLAKTQLPEAAPSSMRMVQHVPAPVRAWSARAIDALPPRLQGLPKPAIAAGLAAIVAVPLIVVIVAVAALRSGGDTKDPRHEGTTSTSTTADEPTKAPVGPTDADLAKAKQAGPSGLEALAKQYPADARVARTRVAVCADAKRWSDALEATRRLLAIDPNMASSKEVDDAVSGAVTSGTAADLDLAIDLMSGPMGAAGVDLLIELQARPGLVAATKTRLGQALGEAGVREHASPAASVFIELRATKKCEERRTLLERAAKDGDARSLATLEAMQRKSGCGFLGLSDCWSCMRKDSALDDTVQAVRARR